MPDPILSAVESLNRDLEAAVERQRSERAGQNERLLELEQIVASLHGRQLTGPPAHSFGASVLAALQEHDAQFERVSGAAARRQDTGMFAMRANVDMSIRAALTNEPSEGSSSEGSYMPRQPGRSGIFGPALRPLRLLDVLPTRPVEESSLEHIRLTVTGDAAEQVFEGDEKAEVAASGTLVRADIATIAAWLPASRQVLADHGALQAVIDRTMRHKVLARLEHQLLNGPGGQGRIEGLLEVAPTLVPSVGTEPADVIGEALVHLANSGYQPGAVVLSPVAWFKIQIMREGTTGEDGYLFGSPTMPVPPALWNTPIVVTPSMDAGKGLVVDVNHVTVLDRQQASVMVSNSHADFFTRNLVAILAELRAGLEIVDAWAMYKFDLAFPGGGG